MSVNGNPPDIQIANPVVKMLEEALAEARADVAGPTVSPTDAGVEALGPDYQPLPVGDALQQYWDAKLPEGERKILAELVKAYPDPVARSWLDDVTGYKRSSRDAYLTRLKARRLVTVAQGSLVRASETLFG